MASPIQWVIKLFDDVSTPAKAIVSSVDQVEKAMKATAGASGALDVALRKTSDGFIGLAEHLQIAQSFASLSQRIQETSLTMEQHSAIAQSLVSVFTGLRGVVDQTAAATAAHAASLRSPLNLADHLAIAKSFEALARNAAEASLSVDEHNQVAQALVGIFQGFNRISVQSPTLLQRWSERLSDLRSRYEEMIGATHRAAEGAERSSGSFGNFALTLNAIVDLGSRAVGVLEGIGRRALEIFDTVGKAQAQKISFELLLGPTGGADLLAYLDRVKDSTRFTKAQLRELVSPLVAQGFNVADIGEILPAALDVGRIRASDPGATAQAIEVFKKIRSTGRLETEAYAALDLNEQDVLGRVGQSIGTRDIATVRSKIGAGQVNPQVLLSSIFASISARTGGPLGTGAVAGANTIDALLNKIQGAPTAIIEKLLGDPQNIAQIEAILRRVLDVFEGLPEAIIGAVSFLQKVIDVLAQIEPFITPIIVGFIAYKAILLATQLPIAIITAAQAALNAVFLINPIVLLVAAVAAAAFLLYRYWEPIRDFFKGIYETVSTFFSSLYDSAVNIAKNIVDGLVNGLKAGITAVVDAVKGLGSAAVDGLKNLLGIASPSRVFAEFGSQTVAGYVQGIDRRAQSVDAAIGRTFGVDALGSQVAPGGALAGIGGASIQVGDIIVQIGAERAQDAQTIAGAVREEVEAILFGTLDRYFLEATGAA